MAILNKGTTYASGDNVTAANLNTLVDSATFKTGSNEATDNSTLQVHSDGYLMVKDGGISSSKLAAGAVNATSIGSGAITSTQLATNSVTSSQIASNAVTSAEIASSAVTSAKIADNAITSAKISDTDTQFLVDDTSTQKKVVINEAGADVDFRVEGDTNANLIVTDAATDKVSIRGAVGSVAPTTIYGGCEFKSANIQISRSNASAGIRLQEDTTLSSPNQQSDILLREADGALVFTKPQKQTDSVTNNSANIGSASKRWQTIYAVNGTINTSDGNQKEQIEELSDAELRVAQACKGLVRKFKIKGGTRKHIGVIAQDVRDAFTAQSLDAHEYGLFCSDTWTDEDTGEEVTQLGIRYDELLAFIISAL